MIDLNRLHENPDEIIKKLKRKDPLFDGEGLYVLSKKVRGYRIEVDELRK